MNKKKAPQLKKTDKHQNNQEKQHNEPFIILDELDSFEPVMHKFFLDVMEKAKLKNTNEKNFIIVGTNND